MKYLIVTFGCRVNQADSLAIEGRLRAAGGVDAPPEDADLLVVNTCSVTASADQGARQTIRRIVRSNPDIRVIVTGCYATRQPDELAVLPNVVRVVGNEQKDAFAFEDALAAEPGPPDSDGPCGRPLEPGVAGRTAFTVRVQTGCGESCSYCIIPRTRGASRSRPTADVLTDVRRAIDAGYREIVITGVHLGSYGRDLGSTSLHTLLRALADMDEDVLFRVSSLEPMDCTPAIVDLVAASPRLAPHFHLPMQHGSDALLRAMRRPYTAAYYAGLVGAVRRMIPHASIGTDAIVGFPGESAADFEQTRALIDALPLSYVHVFPYSDRPGTAASALPVKVDGGAIRDRGRQLRDVGSRKACAFRAAHAGTVRRALTMDDGWSAVTDNYLKVRLPARAVRNTWVHATID